MSSFFFCYERVIPKISKTTGLVFGIPESSHHERAFASLEAVDTMLMGSRGDPKDKLTSYFDEWL